MTHKLRYCHSLRDSQFIAKLGEDGFIYSIYYNK